jgi:hypothetical protein
VRVAVVDGHVEREPLPARKDALELTGWAMTQRRVLRAGEHRREPDPLPRDPAVTDGIDPAVKRLKPALARPAVDRRGRNPEIDELPARDDSVLIRGQFRHPRDHWV